MCIDENRLSRGSDYPDTRYQMGDETNLRLAAIVESSDDAIVAKTCKGVVTSWNPSAERIFGYTADEMIGQSITRLFPPDRLHEEVDFLKRLARGERIEHFETIRIRKDGRLIDVSVMLSPIYDAAGAIVGVSKIARDISERKRQEAALVASRMLLEVTLASIGDGVITTDNAGSITFMNPIAESLTGWTKAEAIGRSMDGILDLISEKTRGRAENPVARVLREGVVVGLANDTLLVSKDGREIPIADSAAPIHDSAGRIFGVVMVFRDVTERRRHEEHLLRLAAVAESSEDAIITKTLGGIVASWNPAAERMLGYSAREIIGRSVTMLVPEHRLAEEAEFMRLMAVGERVQHYETERLHRSGSIVPVSVSLSPLRNRRGVLIGVSSIARDITEIRDREAQLEASNRAKDQFLAMLGHELRNPLGVIMTSVGILSQVIPETGPAAGPVAMISRQTIHLAHLLDDLLDVARISLGKIELNVHPIDLARVVQEAVDTHRHKFGVKSQSLIVASTSDPVVVAGDRVRLLQIIGNLLDNSSKYTPSGGSIWLTLSKGDTGAVIRVRDTGQGLPPDSLESIFEMFTQLGSDIARSEGGLGVGLTLVKRLVHLHEGSVSAHSAGPGLGSEFVVRLPLANTPAAEQRPARIGTVGHRRFVLIEDNDDAREVLSLGLRMRGHEVFPAASGREGVGLAVKRDPDVVIVDLGLPDMTGFEVGQEIRAKLGTAVRMIALSGYSQPDDRKRTAEAGFDLHLVKPVSIETLIEVVATEL
jgi:PAS domain S-box-containing protein